MSDTICFRLNWAVPLSFDFYCFSWYFQPMRLIKSKLATIFYVLIYCASSLSFQFLRVSTCTAFDKFGGLVWTLNNVWYKADTAVKSYRDLPRRASYIHDYSPFSYRKFRSSHVEENSNTECDTSHVGMVNWHLANVLPISVRLSIGEMDGLTPPSLSSSARFIQILNSCKVSPPSIVAIRTPSASSESLNCFKVDSSSLTQCRFKLLKIKSTEPF
jgi:hypothetical protein